MTPTGSSTSSLPGKKSSSFAISESMSECTQLTSLAVFVQFPAIIFFGEAVLPSLTPYISEFWSGQEWRCRKWKRSRSRIRLKLKGSGGQGPENLNQYLHPPSGAIDAIQLPSSSSRERCYHWCQAIHIQTRVTLQILYNIVRFSSIQFNSIQYCSIQFNFIQ